VFWTKPKRASIAVTWLIIARSYGFCLNPSLRFSQKVMNPGSEDPPSLSYGGAGLALSFPLRGLFGSFLDVEVCWSDGVAESIKSQTPSTKFQTNLKFQYQMTEIDLEF
jgi:hypothetical protein